MSEYTVSNPLCIRCDYGPNHDSGMCRGWKDADEPCRNAEPDEYLEDDRREEQP